MPCLYFYVVIFDPDIEPLNLLECESNERILLYLPIVHLVLKKEKIDLTHHSYRFEHQIPPLPEAP
jgi:hypothetical protein